MKATHLPIFLLSFTLNTNVFSKCLGDWPADVKYFSDRMELTATVPKYDGPGRKGCGLKDVNSETAKYIDAISVNIRGKLPEGVAVKTIKEYAKKQGEQNWKECKKQTIRGAEYRKCDREIGDGAVIQLRGGLTGRKLCPKIYRDTCGGDILTDFSMSNANNSCENLGESFRTVTGGFSHISRSHGYDIKAVVYYKKCGVNNENQFESN